MKLPNEPVEGQLLLQWAKDVVRYLRATRITNFAGGRVVQTPNGTALINNPVPQSTDGIPFVCPFGKIVGIASGGELINAIAGGVITCGPSNINVPAKPIDEIVGTDGSYLIYITLDGISPNLDDDEVLILPGIASVSGTPAWNYAAIGDGYPDNTNFTYPDDTGTVIIPIGQLDISDGSISFTPVACGPRTIDQCAGMLVVYPPIVEETPPP